MEIQVLVIKDEASLQSALRRLLGTAPEDRPYRKEFDDSLGTPSADRLKSLSLREKQVMSYVARGYTNREIADALFISVRTIENHRSNLKQKLGLSTRAELVEYAQHLQIFTEDGLNRYFSPKTL